MRFNIEVELMELVVGLTPELIAKQVGQEYPKIGTFVVTEIGNQYDLYVSQGYDEPAKLLCAELGQYFYVPDVIHYAPEKNTISDELMIRLLTNSIKAAKC